MPLPSGLRALDHHDYRRFYAAQLVALVGSWMQAVAQAWLVLQLTNSPFKLIVLMASCNTSMQLRAPDALRGRVMSLYTWVSGGIFPIGAFLVGAISQRWGVSAAFLWNGILGLAVLTAIMLWWRLRHDRPRR